MGVTNYVPLFRISGLGPLGRLAAPAVPVMTHPSHEAASRYAGAGGASLSDVLGGRRERLREASSDPKDVGGIRGSTGPSPKGYSIKVVSGKSARSEFPLSADREFVIGRLNNSDIPLVEDLVSRQHAKISIAGEEVVLEDLKSSSGTFVNGRKIQKTTLKEGDRILIGSTILSLAFGSVAECPEAPAREATVPHSGKAAPKSRMSGLLEVIPLADLLQTLTGAQKSGVLSLSSDRGLAKVYLRKGRIYFCSIDGSPDVHPRKALYRLLGWTQGAFGLEPPNETPVSQELNDSIDFLLMNGTCDLDEISRFGEDLPKPGSKLTPNLAAGRLRDLSPEELDLIQLVLQYGTLEGVLDHYSGSDLEAYQRLIPLIKKGLIQV